MHNQSVGLILMYVGLLTCLSFSEKQLPLILIWSMNKSLNYTEIFSHMMLLLK